MPDRRRRTAFRQPLPERDASSPGGRGSDGSDDNPFAPPPENRPDQPWQPRHPVNTAQGSGNGNDSGSGEGSGESGSSGDRPAWGGQWSSRQPGRQNGGFGGRPGQGGTGGGGGQGGPEGSPGGLRWDPTDPAQRRARYALLCGMWAFFFALFDFPEIALLLGSLAVYWAISSLRSKPRSPAADGSGQAAGPARTPGAPAPAAPAAPVGGRQQTTAAVSGLVTALLALSIVAATFTVQLVYRDYYTCVNDALTKAGQVACNDQLPKPLEPLFGVKD
ncbi:hypothetical protein ACFCV8_33305 [Streptomyces sp. NPDC056347]|uniref:hypothetical protein n=1 Tax=Streptomyces sp. NPDC056347 TaxID=3345790 RepID=UPI0035DE8E23